MVFVLGKRDFADRGATQRLGGECGTNFFVANFDDVFVCRIGGLHIGPVGQQFALRTAHTFFALLGQVACSFSSFGAAGLVHLEHVGSGVKLLNFACEFGLGACTFFVATHGVADFREIACACSWNDGCLVGAEAHFHQRQ